MRGYQRNAALLAALGGACFAVSGAVAEDAAPKTVLDRIVVVGSAEQASDLAGSADFIGTEELERFNYGDVNRVLRLVPGVYIQEEDGFGLRPNIGIRGSGNDRSAKITLMEDGILMAPAPYAAPSAYYFPTMARMNAVELVKGAGAIKYGPQTVGGALNLYSTPIPDAEDRVGGFLKGHVGSDGLLRAHGQVGGWLPMPGQHGFDVGASFEYLRDQSDGFKQLDSGGPTGFRINDYVAKLALATHSGGPVEHKLELKFQHSDQLSDETYLGLTLDDFRADPYRRYRASQRDEMDVEHKTYQASHVVSFKDWIDLTTVLYKTKTRRAWYKLQDVMDGSGSYTSLSSVLADPTGDNDAAYDALVGAPGFVSPDDALRIRNNNRAYEAWGVQSVLGLAGDVGPTAHDLEISLRYHEDEEDRFQNQDGYRMDNGTLVLTTEGPAGGQTNRLGEAKAWALFVQDTIVWNNFTFTPGIRYERIHLTRTDWSTADPDRTVPTNVRKNTIDVVIPGASLLYAIDEEWEVFAGAHKGFSNPAPGSSAEEESSWNYEAGVRFTTDPGFVQLIGFYSDYSNLLGTCTASTGGGCVIGDQFDAGEVDIKGIELVAGIDLGLAFDWKVAVPVSVAYTYTHAEFGTSFTSDYDPWGDVTKGDRLPYLPGNQLTVTVGLDVGLWRVTLAANYVDAARAVAGRGDIPAGERIDGRLLFDLTGEIDLTHTIALFGSIENVTDQVYNVSFSPAGARPGKPRTMFAGLNFEF